MTIKKNNVAIASKTDIDFDNELVLRVPNKNTTFTVEIDGTDFITFSFTGATLEQA